VAVTSAIVTAVARSPEHDFSKQTEDAVRLVEGFGVEGDAHAGATVQHRSRAARDPELPNLRQVHLLDAEQHDELRAQGFEVAPGELGENVTTRGIDLRALSTASRLSLGAHAIVELTGLRNPCAQLDRFQDGLMQALLERDEHGGLIRKAGVVAVVVRGGEVRAGDRIAVELPATPHTPLAPV